MFVGAQAPETYGVRRQSAAAPALWLREYREERSTVESANPKRERRSALLPHSKRVAACFLHPSPWRAVTGKERSITRTTTKTRRIKGCVALPSDRNC